MDLRGEGKTSNLSICGQLGMPLTRVWKTVEERGFGLGEELVILLHCLNFSFFCIMRVGM